MRRRQADNPKRRIAPPGSIPVKTLVALADRLRYVGSPLHKLHPNDYGLLPPLDPRPSKSPCDDIRPVPIAEARDLFRLGIAKGLISPLAESGVPKYVWAVDACGEVYEAKTKPERETDYHGYRLGTDDGFQRRAVLAEWNRR